jgi:FecR-like protein
MADARRFVVLTGIALTFAAGPASAQGPKAGIVTTLEGHVTATRAAAAQPVALKFRDDVFMQDRIATAEQSLARMLLGGKAVVTVRERSVLTITEVPGHSTIALESGKFALAVAREKMRPGETIEIRTPNAVAGVRGTVVVTEVQGSATQPASLRSSMYLLQGSLDGVQPLNPATGARLGTPQTLNVLQQFQVVGLGPGSVAPIRPEQLGVIRAGLQPGSRPGSQATNREGLNVAGMATAVALANAISSPGGLSQVAAPGGASSPEGLFPNSGSAPIPGESFPTPTFAPNNPVSGPTAQPIAELISPPASSASLVGFGFPVSGFTSCDDCGVPVNFGFTFPFRGQNYTGGTLSSNGFLLLGGNTGQFSFTPNVPEFLSGLPRIAVGWTDHDLRVGNGIKENAIPGGIAYTFDSVGEFSVRPANSTFQVQLYSTGRIVFAYQSMNILFHNILVGVTPGGGVSDPGQVVFLSAVPFTTANGTVYQFFVPGTSFNLNGHSVIFTPNGTGWTVVDPPLTVLLDDAALTQYGPLYDFKEKSLALNFPMLALGPDTQDTLNDSLLHDVGGTLTLRSGLMRIGGGGQLTYASSNPIVWLNGGTYTIGDSAAPAVMFDLAGLASTDRPIQGANGGAISAPVLQTTAAVVDVPGDGGRIVRLDAALLEATAPLINLQQGSRLSAGGHVVELASNARLSHLVSGDALVKLDGSTLNIMKGHLVNVTGGSRLSIAGDLLRLANASQVNLFNGVLVSLSGGSSASIGGSLVSFLGANNVLNVNNAFAPTTFVSGIPVYVGAGASLADLSLGSGFTGLNASGNTVRVNGAALPTGATAASGITGSLIAIQGNR